MKQLLLLLLPASLWLLSCSGNGGAKTFCDTTCRSDSFNFVSNDRWESKVSIGVKNCRPDSIAWTHGGMAISRQIPVESLTNQDVRLNKNAISCVIKDTSHAWLTFNDCITGRGFLFKLPFNKSGNIQKILGALNSFDPKFSVQENLRAYTDRGSLFVINIDNEKQAVMTLKEQYDVDFNKLHEIVDSVNITSTRMFIRLKKNGQDVNLEKKIDL